MAGDRLLLQDAIGGFAHGQPFRAVLLLTYCFDGVWLEETFVPDLFDRQVTTALLIRDRNAVFNEARNVRYHRVNAAFSNRIFHSKLGIFVAEDRALAFIGSANLTRGGLERNLELGSLFELSPDGGPHSLFKSLLDYVSGPLAREVAGESKAALRDTAVALREVIERTPKDQQCRHTFLHNYQQTLWDQLLEALPHRHVAKVSIVSPFFEPNGQISDDPAGQADDGIFTHLFDDLTFEPIKGERPISIFFQQWEGTTQLPLDKLKTLKPQLDLRQRLSTTADEPRPLHGKMLIIEGAKGPKRDPYLVTLSGSPNFTSAAFLSCPPDGNAETALLTRLPVKRNGTQRIWSTLRLDSLFGVVKDWNTLRYVQAPRPTLPRTNAFRVNDAWLFIADHKLVINWQGSTSSASELRVLVEKNGLWTTLGSITLGTEAKTELDVASIIQADESGIVTVIAQIRVELVRQDGAIVAVSEAPVNVDCPQQFCGLAMVGPHMASVDQRIAFAGCGISQTYREQQKFLEQHRRVAKRKAKEVQVLTHQADLDRFFRNLHAGFRGMRARSAAMPNSEFTLRRSLRDLGRWYEEVLIPDGQVPTNECRLFLVDRLGSALQHTLNLSLKSNILAPKLGDVTRDFQLHDVLNDAREWVQNLADKRLAAYTRATVIRLQGLLKLLTELERR